MSSGLLLKRSLVFVDKVPYSHSASLHSGEEWTLDTSKLLAGKLDRGLGICREGRERASSITPSRQSSPRLNLYSRDLSRLGAFVVFLFPSVS